MANTGCYPLSFTHVVVILSLSNKCSHMKAPAYTRRREENKVHFKRHARYLKPKNMVVSVMPSIG